MEEPGVSWYPPIQHWVHTDEVVARTAVLNSPTPHDWHAASPTPPVRVRYLPAPHAGQVPVPVSLYLPVGQ